MEKILYSPKEGTTGFWGLRAIPDEPECDPVKWDERSKIDAPCCRDYVDCPCNQYKQALESCKSNSLEIVNTEVIGVTEDSMNQCLHIKGKYLNPGDIFDLPEGYKLENGGYCEGCKRAGLYHCAHADTCGYAKDVLRLVKTETKASVKSEFQWVYAIDRLPQHMVSRPLRINANYYAGYYDYSLKRFMCPNIGPQGLPINLIEWLEEVPQPEPEESQNEKEWERFWYRFGENDFDMRNAHKYYIIQRKKQ
ncbi:MAG TPA: hypothetical protein VFZ33_01080 [Chitinophagaceae bacterium]